MSTIEDQKTKIAQLEDRLVEDEPHEKVARIKALRLSRFEHKELDEIDDDQIATYLFYLRRQASIADDARERARLRREERRYRS